MRSKRTLHRDLSMSWLLQMEQWIALLVGIACLAVFVWAALDGQEAFSARHLSHLSATVLACIGWSLTIVVGLFGIVMMRIAFTKQREPEPDDATSRKGFQLISGGSGATSNRFLSIAADNRRQ